MLNEAIALFFEPIEKSYISDDLQQLMYQFP